MKAIVCVDEKFGIGKNGTMLFYLPQDLKFFKEKTLNKTVIMGYNTFLSLPNQKPLAQRENIVLSRHRDLKLEGVKVLKSKDELFKYLGDKTDNAFIIGGEQIYNEFLPNCDVAYVTKVNADGKAQKFFPNIDRLSQWKLKEKSEDIISSDYTITFNTYVKQI